MSSLDDFLRGIPQDGIQPIYILPEGAQFVAIEPPEMCPYILHSADLPEGANVSGDELGDYIDERIAALKVQAVEVMTPREKALCDEARRHERAKIVNNLLEMLAIIRTKKEGVTYSLPLDIAAERTEYIADQIRLGVL